MHSMRSRIQQAFRATAGLAKLAPQEAWWLCDGRASVYWQIMRPVSLLTLATLIGRCSSFKMKMPKIPAPPRQYFQFCFFLH